MYIYIQKKRTEKEDFESSDTNWDTIKDIKPISFQ